MNAFDFVMNFVVAWILTGTVSVLCLYKMLDRQGMSTLYTVYDIILWPRFYIKTLICTYASIISTKALVTVTGYPGNKAKVVTIGCIADGKFVKTGYENGLPTYPGVHAKHKTVLRIAYGRDKPGPLNLFIINDSFVTREEFLKVVGKIGAIGYYISSRFHAETCIDGYKA